MVFNIIIIIYLVSSKSSDVHIYKVLEVTM